MLLSAFRAGSIAPAVKFAGSPSAWGDDGSPSPSGGGDAVAPATASEDWTVSDGAAGAEVAFGSADLLAGEVVATGEASPPASGVEFWLALPL